LTSQLKKVQEGCRNINLKNTNYNKHTKLIDLRNSEEIMGKVQKDDILESLSLHGTHARQMYPQLSCSEKPKSVIENKKKIVKE
jgi:hypothetical protein